MSAVGTAASHTRHGCMAAPPEPHGDGPLGLNTAAPRGTAAGVPSAGEGALLGDRPAQYVVINLLGWSSECYGAKTRDVKCMKGNYYVHFLVPMPMASSCPWPYCF